ncbi:MAG: hypothetical protein KF678_07405 [Phycisphaeraceae bacterium]|nr:hypothetical protein [Phycisphaeraceae bacterium]
MSGTPVSTQQKALAINLAATWYGSFAEIGAGQEVARWFFKVGGAAGTVAKTISAYDMAISDGLYGASRRYVSRERLQSMLEHEFGQVSAQLAEKVGEKRCFFAFADTVATRRFRSPEHGRGWIGVRFQTDPNAEPSQITLHAHLLDGSAEREQEALGILGVNLLHGAFFLHHTPLDLIVTLMDELSRERVEIDMIKFSGPAFARIDNRLMSLELVKLGYTDAAMFTAQGEVVQPSEVLHKKPILVERGHFRPVTNLTLDILQRAREAFLTEPGVEHQEPVIIAEMSLRNLLHAPELANVDFLARAETLGALGFHVLISRFQHDYEIAEYLASYTDRLIGFALSVRTVKQLVQEQFYTHLAGGVLEAVGRLYKRSVKLYIYPARDPESGRVETMDDVALPKPWQHLHRLLRELGRVAIVQPANESWLSIEQDRVMTLIEAGDPLWERMVPTQAAHLIRSNEFFADMRRPTASAQT